MKLAMVIALAAAALFVLDRLALAAEARGWIYWRRRRANPGTRAGAMLEMQSLLEPSKRHVIQVQRAETEEEDDAGDDVDRLNR